MASSPRLRDAEPTPALSEAAHELLHTQHSGSLKVAISQQHEDEPWTSMPKSSEHLLLELLPAYVSKEELVVGTQCCSDAHPMRKHALVLHSCWWTWTLAGWAFAILHVHWACGARSSS